MTSSPPTRRCTGRQHTDRRLQHAQGVGRQWKLGRYPILSNIPADGNQQGTIDPDERSSRRFWRNKGAPPRRNHIIHSGRRPPTADHQGCDIPSGRLLVCLQCYPWATHPQFVKGCNLNLPPDD